MRRDQIKTERELREELRTRPVERARGRPGGGWFAQQMRKVPAPPPGEEVPRRDEGGEGKRDDGNI